MNENGNAIISKEVTIDVTIQIKKKNGHIILISLFRYMYILDTLGTYIIDE